MANDFFNGEAHQRSPDQLYMSSPENSSGFGRGFRPGSGPEVEKSQPATSSPVHQRTRHPIEELALAALGNTPLTDFIKQACIILSQQLGVEYVALLELGADNRLLLRGGVGWRTGFVDNATVDAGLSSQAGYTLLQHGPVFVTDLQKETRFHCDKLLEQHGVRSGVTVSVPSKHGELCGTLGAHTTTPRNFTEEEADFVAQVAEILGNAMEQRKLEGRARYAEERFGALVHASSLLAASTDYDAALHHAAHIALDHLADWCFVDVVASNHPTNNRSGNIYRLAQMKDVADEGTKAQPPQLRYDYLLETTLRHGTAAVLRSGQPEVISPVDGTLLRDIARDNEHLGLLQELSPGGYMCVPMQTRQRVIGSMGFICASDKHYQEEDLALASSLARYTALAIANSLHFPEGKVVSGELVRRVKRHEPATSVSRRKEVQPLTRRQLEVVEAMIPDRTAKQIGVELGISTHTVQNHIRDIRQVFGGCRRWQIVPRARELGILPEPFKKDGSSY